MSDYPRMMYHSDGRTAVAHSAHDEKHEFDGWSRSPDAVHRKEPADGDWKMTRPVEGAAVEPGAARGPVDQPGPVDAGTVRSIIRQEMQEHPGLDLSAVASKEDVQALHEKLDALLAHLTDPSEGSSEGEASTQKRRGRPPGSTNRLSGAAGAEE